MRLAWFAGATCVLLGCASGGDANGSGGTDAGSGGVITGVGGAGGDTSDGLPLGAECDDDAECASNICEEAFLDLPDRVCVERCAGADDCPEGFFCESISPGSMDGYCIPRSPAHCLPCQSNSDCGHFTEVCMEGTCHVDCSLSGQAACPDDYTCASFELGNTTRELCVPEATDCDDALGGFCDHVSTPQPCSRENDDGVCMGERTCDEALERYGECGAQVPLCKASCEDPDPAGCALEACGDAANTVEHCGSCNSPCPGVGGLNTSPSCDGGMCSFACAGESYDVDNNVATGCEESDNPTGNHAQGTATDVGTFPCSDGSSNRNIAGTIHSDQRAHVPPITGFDATTGAAPDWYTLYADGGFCQNEVVLTLDVNGSGNLSCYRLTVLTDEGTYVCNTNASGDCNINEDGTGAYSDNSDIYLVVEKTCPAASAGSVSYTVTGHL